METRFMYRAFFEKYPVEDKTGKFTFKPKMVYEGKPGDCLRWLAERQNCKVMQCTGLQDRKGKLIYEGDIIEIETSKDRAFSTGRNDVFRIEVSWSGDGFIGYRIGDRRSSYSIRYSGSAVLKREVIGNVFEHPELLKGKNNWMGTGC